MPSTSSPGGSLVLQGSAATPVGTAHSAIYGQEPGIRPSILVRNVSLRSSMNQILTRKQPLRYCWCMRHSRL